MRVILSEDVIRRVLNESIDEVIMEETLEEDWGDTAKKYGKTAWNGLKTLGNWAKNRIAMYMDKNTGGRWNQKYNIQAKGNGLFVGSFYLKKWFEIHYNRLYDIIYGTYYGNRTYYYTEINGRNVNFHHDWKRGTYTLNDKYGMIKYGLELDGRGNPSILSVYGYDDSFISSARSSYDKANQLFMFNIQTKPWGEATEMAVGMDEDDSTPESYVAKNCTFQNFRGNTKNTLGEGDFTDAVELYINNKIQGINNSNMAQLENNPNMQIDYKPLLNSLTMNSFNWWYGRTYNKERQAQTAQQAQPTQPTQ